MTEIRPLRRPSQDGFTLLELLISLAVSGLLLAILSQTLGTLQIAARRAMQADNAGNDMERARQVVASLLSAALPPSAGDDGNRFAGQPDAAEFTAAPPNALRRLGPLRMRLMIAPTGTDQLGLFAEFRPASGRITSTADVQRDLLIGGLQWAQMAYSAGAASAVVAATSGPTELQNRWTDPGRLPALVQVRWKLTGEVAESQPVIVAIRRTLADGCRFDPISLTCRGSDGR